MVSFFFKFLFFKGCDEAEAIYFCNNCEMDLCFGCLSYLHKRGKFKEHLKNDIILLKDKVKTKCDEHRLELNYYCYDCNLNWLVIIQYNL